MQANNTRKNEFKLRVYDADTLTSMYELLDTKQFDSVNELLNCALERGVAEIYAAYGKARALDPVVVPERADISRLERKVQALQMTVDDVFVLLNTIEMLAATTFNVLCRNLGGEPVSKELIEQGYMSDLPNFVREVRDKIVESLEKREQEE